MPLLTVNHDASVRPVAGLIVRIGWRGSNRAQENIVGLEEVCPNFAESMALLARNRPFAMALENACIPAHEVQIIIRGSCGVSFFEVAQHWLWNSCRCGPSEQLDVKAVGFVKVDRKGRCSIDMGADHFGRVSSSCHQTRNSTIHRVHWCADQNGHTRATQTSQPGRR